MVGTIVETTQMVLLLGLLLVLIAAHCTKTNERPVPKSARRNASHSNADYQTVELAVPLAPLPVKTVSLSQLCKDGWEYTVLCLWCAVASFMLFEAVLEIFFTPPASPIVDSVILVLGVISAACVLITGAVSVKRNQFVHSASAFVHIVTLLLVEGLYVYDNHRREWHWIFPCAGVVLILLYVFLDAKYKPRTPPFYDENRRCQCSRKFLLANLTFYAELGCFVNTYCFLAWMILDNKQ